MATKKHTGSARAEEAVPYISAERLEAALELGRRARAASNFPNRTAQRAARKRTEQDLAQLAEQAFSYSLNEGVRRALQHGSPRRVQDFNRWWRDAMRRELERREAVMPL